MIVTEVVFWKTDRGVKHGHVDPQQIADRVAIFAVGKAADIVVVDTAVPHLSPMYRPVSHLVYAAKGGDVKDVMVGGRFVVRDRTLLTVDVEELMDRVGERCRNIGR